MTAFRELTLWDCDGRVAPTLCSGLAVASRFPLVEKEFNSYTEHGDAAKATIDGDTATQMNLLDSEMIPRKLSTYFGRHMSSDHGRSDFRPLANLGSNNFFSKCQFFRVKLGFF